MPGNSQDVLTYHNNHAHTGLNSKETILTPANVNSASFGKLFTISVDGKVDAEPLYISSVPISASGNHNLMIVATEHGSLYAFDADTMPAFFQGKLYFGPVGQPILAFQFKNARLSPAPVAQTSNRFGYPGATPSVSANNGQNGIVWASANTNSAVLYAYNAKNLRELYDSNQAANGRDHFGAGNKFMTPMIANGKVYVGTTNGVGVFGLLSAPSAGAPAGREPNQLGSVKPRPQPLLPVGDGPCRPSGAQP